MSNYSPCANLFAAGGTGFGCGANDGKASFCSGFVSSKLAEYAITIHPNPTTKIVANALPTTSSISGNQIANTPNKVIATVTIIKV